MWFVWRKLCRIGFVHNFFLQLYRRCTTVHNFIPETFCKNNCYNQRLWNRTFSGTLFTSWKYVNDVTISAIVPACGWRLNSIFISYRVASQSYQKGFVKTTVIIKGYEIELFRALCSRVGNTWMMLRFQQLFQHAAEDWIRFLSAIGLLLNPSIKF